MRIAVLIAFNSISLKSAPLATGTPSEMNALAKEYSTGKKELEEFNKLICFERPYRSWKLKPITPKFLKKEESDLVEPPEPEATKAKRGKKPSLKKTK